ncbi:uncharacterized protein CDAR_462241 [Caerostris darwini]|uniref:Ig-like domain-containing protein n=1 Tax=Caerostris darwini TaxID=1538125 RepID=A0AAV4RCQ8_9ARAC|nr:uncharacterized protein CDAR_462241 [Caerostris darwini]
MDFPDKESIIKGRSLNLHCKAQGFPPPKITWFIGNLLASDLKESDFRISIYSADGGMTNSYLIKRDVNETDTGLYTCRAENSIDSGTTTSHDEKSAFVFVRAMLPNKALKSFCNADGLFNVTNVISCCKSVLKSLSCPDHDFLSRLTLSCSLIQSKAFMSQFNSCSLIQNKAFMSQFNSCSLIQNKAFMSRLKLMNKAFMSQFNSCSLIQSKASMSQFNSCSRTKLSCLPVLTAVH